MTAYLVKNIFVILHVITAAAWFGLGLRLAGQARTVLNLDSSSALALADDIRRSVRLMGIFIVLTFVFALIAFFAGGGFGAYGPIYHTSLTLIVILILLQFLLIRPSWKKLQSGLAAEEKAGQVESYRKRLAMGTGIGHLIWLVLLVLMFWNQFSAAL